MASWIIEENSQLTEAKKASKEVLNWFFSMKGDHWVPQRPQLNYPRG